MVNPQSKKESPTQPSTWNDTNQHWIPQFLLKGFGIRSKSSTIYELDKQTKVVTVRNVEKIASKQHLLTDRDDDLVKAIERRATEVISAIRKLDFAQNLDEWPNRRTSCCGWPTDISHCQG